MASGVILPHREVPFSAANFKALRVGAPLRNGKETQSLVLLEQGGVDAERERQKIARAREYEGRCDDAFRFWQWVALGLAVMFIVSVVLMIAVICIRLNETFEAVQSLSGSSSSEASSLKQIVEHAVQSAENVNMATANMARATGLAHATAEMAAPQLQRAMNETVGIVDDLRAFSFHPQWTVSTGGVTPVGLRHR